MHLDEGRLQRLLDGELASTQEAAVRQHVAGCEDCRSRLAQAQHEQEENFAALSSLDVPAPTMTAGAIAALPRGAARSSPRPLPRAPLAWAAGFAIALALGGLAYALPGSPLRGWAVALARWIGPGGTLTAERAPEPAAPPEVAGVSIAPGAKLVVSFLHARPDGRVRIAWSDGAEVEVRAPRGAAAFESGAESLRIDDREAVTFEVRIPRSAPWIEIEVEGASLFRKVGDRVTGPPPGVDGTILLPLAATGS